MKNSLVVPLVKIYSIFPWRCKERASALLSRFIASRGGGPEAHVKRGRKEFRGLRVWATVVVAGVRRMVFQIWRRSSVGRLGKRRNFESVRGGDGVGDWGRWTRGGGR